MTRSELTELAAFKPREAGSQPVIKVHELRKRYGDLDAVRGITFDVAEGEIFGLIGPDGAGKTSTLQVLSGVMALTSGTAAIFGADARSMRSQTGYLTQAFSLYPDLSVIENLRYTGELRRVPPKEIDTRGWDYLRLFSMDRFAGRLAGQLSGGMKQKLALACALVPQPRVLLLDEPTTGVDPVSRREFWDTLAHLAVGGLTILVATPYLDEAERCHRVALIHQGQIQQLGTPTELRESLHAKRLELRAREIRKAEETLSAAAGKNQDILDVQRFGDRIDILVRDPEKAQKTLKETFDRSGIAIDEIRVDEPTLENTFVARLQGLRQNAQAIELRTHHDHRELRGKTAIGAEKITKQFGSFTAVKDVSLRIKYGEVYGLLGANGAGKTTTIKMLCGLLDRSSGEMQLSEETGNFRSKAIRQKIGYMSQKFSLYDDLTICENLNFFAGVYGVPEEEREEKMRWTLSFSGLAGRQDQITGSLPGGWKQRVAFGAAIMHEPSILFLDEPTSGVDPLARRAFWNIINRLADTGTAILVTTHYLEEAEQCNRLGMMVAGELVAEGTPSEIKGQQHGHLLEFITDKPQRATDLLKSDAERWRVSLFGDRLHVITDEDAATAIRQTTAQLEAAGIQVLHAREGRFSLEDVFISIVEKSRLQGKVAHED